MYNEIGRKNLKTGQEMIIASIQGPDGAWIERISPFLAHKGEVWDWQIRETLGGRTEPLEARYYVGMVDEAIVGNICTFTHKGVGILGHVFTAPEYRRKGVCAAIMTEVMEDLKLRDAQSVILGTEYDSPAFHIYRRFGFESIYPRSGDMEWYRDTIDSFENEWFVCGPSTVRETDWRDWPGLTALTSQREGSGIRIVSLQGYNRWSMEHAFLSLYRQMIHGEGARAIVLESELTGASAGLATLVPDRRFPGVSLLDLFMHPRFSDSGLDLINGLSLGDHDGTIQSYAESSDEPKIASLKAAGLSVIVELKRQIVLESGPVDVVLLGR